VTQVQFKLDGQPLGAPVTAPPFATAWDTRTAAQGPHTLTAEAGDAAGNVGASAGVVVNVDNSAPPPAAITIDRSVSIQSKSTLRTPGLTTAGGGVQLLAFVAMDGPNGPGLQQSTVSGGGLTWTLVKRSNSQAGVSEVWTARANTVLSSAVISATPLRRAYDGLLRVTAFNGASGTGVAGAAGAPSGAPDIYLPGVAAGSWVFAVGNDWDRAVARTPVAGQVLQQQWIDTKSGDTFWVQSTAVPSTALGLVTIHDSAPTTDQWNYAAVELVAAPATATSTTSFAKAASIRTAVAAAPAPGTPVTAGLSTVPQGGLCHIGLGALLPSAKEVRAIAATRATLRRVARRAARAKSRRRAALRRQHGRTVPHSRTAT
jgi:hypothetical protein